MERDFLGLGFKEPLAMVKEEVQTDGYKEIGFSNGSGTQWPFTSKVSALPQLLSFKVGQEDKTKKIMPDPLASSPFLSFSNASVYEHVKKHSVAETQKPLNYIKQDGSSFSLNNYPMQHVGHYADGALDEKLFPVSNRSVSISTGESVENTLFSKNLYATTDHSMASTSIKPQLLEGVPVSSPHSTIPSISPRNVAMVSESSAQLTIFYAGMVNVYDSISPEKAKAIMFLAGNGTSSSSNKVQPNGQVHLSSPKPCVVNLTLANQSLVTPPCSRLSSPISVSSQSASGPSSIEEVVPAKTTIAAPAPIGKLETPKPTAVNGSSTINMMPSVPQARKASLARFLEKRKERLMNVAAPYNLEKKSAEGGPLKSSIIDVSATPAAATTISLFGNQKDFMYDGSNVCSKL